MLEGVLKPGADQSGKKGASLPVGNPDDPLGSFITPADASPRPEPVVQGQAVKQGMPWGLIAKWSLPVLVLMAVTFPFKGQILGAAGQLTGIISGQQAQAEREALQAQARRAEVYARIQSGKRLYYGDAVVWEIVDKYCFDGGREATPADKQICEWGMDGATKILALREMSVPEPQGQIGNGTAQTYGTIKLTGGGY